MKFRIVLLLLAIAAATLFGACRKTIKTPANADTGAAVNTSAAASDPAKTRDVIEITEAGVTMIAPAGFTHEIDEDDIIVKSPSEADFEIVITVPDDADYDETREDAPQEIDEYVTDVTFVDQDASNRVNEFDTAVFKGTGKDRDSGNGVNWVMRIIRTDKRPVEVIAYGKKDSVERNGDIVTALVGSIKKLEIDATN